MSQTPDTEPRFIAVVLVERFVRQFAYTIVEGNTRQELKQKAVEQTTDDCWCDDEDETETADKTTVSYPIAKARGL